MRSPGTLFVLGGPTAAGKTELAIELAQRFGARLVSADAMQVYRGMDIGTAKPSAELLARFPHDCIDVREIDEDYSVADFLRAVAAARAEAERVIVVGGTPFWLSAFVRPLAPLPSGDPELRARLAELEDPHARLAQVDPVSAARLHPNDRVRILRALEVHALSGRPMSELWEEGARLQSEGDPADSLRPAAIAWLDREELRPRIGQRLQQMMAAGYLDEVRGLLDRGFGADHKPMRSLGYCHLREHLEGLISLEEAERRTERDTWRLARKQRTWARGLGWIAVDADEVRRRAAEVFAPPA